MKELTYEELAAELGVSPREARRVVRRFKAVCTPIRYSHKCVRFTAGDVRRLKANRRAAAIKAGRRK